MTHPLSLEELARQAEVDPQYVARPGADRSANDPSLLAMVVPTAR